MSGSTRRTTDGRTRLLYRDRERGLIMGVCAGVSEFFDWNTLTVRVITLVMLIVAFVPTALVYFTAGFLLRDRPLRYYGENDPESWRDEMRFWRRSKHEYQRRSQRT